MGQTEQLEVRSVPGVEASFTLAFAGAHRTRLNARGGEPGDLIEFEVGKRPGEAVRAGLR